MLFVVYFRCLDRLLENWEPLRKFFRDEKDSFKGGKGSKYAVDKVDIVYTFLRSPTNHLFALFLRYAAKMLEPFLVFFQAEDPRIHLLQRETDRLVKHILCKFVKSDSMTTKVDGKVKEVPLQSVNFRDRANQKNDVDLGIGEEAFSFIAQQKENHLRPEKLADFYSGARKFFVELTSYLISRLLGKPNDGPREDTFLSLAEVTDVDLQTQVSFSQLRTLIRKFPVLVPEGVDVNTLSEQFSLYQVTDFSNCKAERIDQTWANIGKDPNFAALSVVMRHILTVPHSSAHCERIFSCVQKNKTDQRTTLGQDTLESLLILKSADPLESVQKMDKAALQKLKSAYSLSLIK